MANSISVTEGMIEMMRWGAVCAFTARLKPGTTKESARLKPGTTYERHDVQQQQQRDAA